MKYNRSHRRAVIVKRQRIAILILGCLLFLSGIFMVHSQTGVVNAETNRQKYFTHITIAQGDTLWEIASQYMTEEYDSIPDYIEEVEHMNHISADSIVEGASLMIPYYAEHPLP